MKPAETAARLANYMSRIRALREDNDLTQTQAAAVIHVGQKLISKKLMSISKLKKQKKDSRSCGRLPVLSLPVL